MLASEFDKRVRASAPVPSNRLLYLAPASGEAELRFTSEGTRYRQVRMNYHPYAQVTRAAVCKLLLNSKNKL